ncbi:MAG: tRNA preQ1(34) S-adenosylmethionine ribosyltransferase-isomerase QueA [bacterium]
MKTSDFDYSLPEELIAHEPTKKRDGSRLLVLNRQKKSLEHKKFFDLLDYLNSGDLLVLNNTKVIPARLIGQKDGGSAKIETLLVSRLSRGDQRQVWKCLVKPGKRLKVGSKINFGVRKLVGEVLEKLETGEQLIEFRAKEDFWTVLHSLGKIPLPPYIKKVEMSKLTAVNKGERYQTVFAEVEGASAAPTAGLHFTPQLLRKIEQKGIKLAQITLHTGLGTFLPVRTESIHDHKMHAEYYEVSAETLAAIKQAKRVVAVGTTVVRALESVGCEGEGVSCEVDAVKGETDIFIYPGYDFKVVDAMITNFHWPKSTLMMLVSAFAQDTLKSKNRFAGRDLVMKAYNEAMKQKYRFFSFGDAMMIV